MARSSAAFPGSTLVTSGAGKLITSVPHHAVGV
jgi:hypothetical protein